MQVGKQQQKWEITVKAKANNFNFEFKSAHILPTWKFHRLSVLVKLRKVLLNVKLNSETTAAVSRQQKPTLKSKLLRIFKKIRIPRAKNRDQTIHNLESESPLLTLKHRLPKEPVSIATCLIGIVVFLFQSISSVVQRDSILYGLAALLFLFSLLSSKYNAGKIVRLLVIVMVAVSASSTVLDFNNCSRFCGKYVSNYIGKAWKYAALVHMN